MLTRGAAGINAKAAKEGVKPSQYRPVIDRFIGLLEENEYYGYLFDENDLERSLCDSRGVFICAGLYCLPACNGEHGEHWIRPAANRERRQRFSKWEFDHLIELAVVANHLLLAIKTTPPGKVVNWKYFYALIFTLNNLHFVDGIYCHDKKPHKNFKPEAVRYYIDAEEDTDFSGEMNVLEESDDEQNLEE